MGIDRTVRYLYGLPDDEDGSKNSSKPLTGTSRTKPKQPMALNTMCTTSPLVSVVVASYNRLDSLLWLLNDLREQKPIDGAFEVVVVDDGSSQAVAPEVNSRTFSFDVRVLTQANRGPAVARDVGIGEARGEWIVIVDDDMVLPETFLSAHMAAHTGADKNPPADVVLGHIRGPADATGLALFERFHQFSLDRFVAAHQNGSLSLDGGRLCTGNVSFRKADYLAVGGFDLALGRLEDRELGIRFESANYSLVFSVDAWNEHRSDHEDVLTWRRRSRQYGQLDTVISAKYGANPAVSPWAFLPQIPVATRPVAVLAATIPLLGRAAAGWAYWMATVLDRRGRETVALQGVAVTYALDYFAGVGSTLNGFVNVQRSLRRWNALRMNSTDAASVRGRGRRRDRGQG